MPACDTRLLAKQYNTKHGVHTARVAAVVLKKIACHLQIGTCNGARAVPVALTTASTSSRSLFPACSTAVEENKVCRAPLPSTS